MPNENPIGPNTDINDILSQDPKFKEGLAAYHDIEEKAHEKASEIAKLLVDQILKKEDKFNISTAIMAVAKTLTHLASYLYDTEEQFLTDVQKARTCAVSDIIPALLDPQPCGICEECRNGNPTACLKPNVRADYTETRFLPILANMLIEYDMFNKVLHMYVFREEIEKRAKEESKKRSKTPVEDRQDPPPTSDTTPSSKRAQRASKRTKTASGDSTSPQHSLKEG